MKNRMIIGKNGINWLKGAYECLMIEKNIWTKESNNYPSSQRGINAKKWVKKLHNASSKIKALIKGVEKELTI